MLKQTKLIENIKRIGIICTLWIICLFFYHLLIYFAVDEVNPGKLGLAESFLSASILGLLLGLTNGFLEVFIFRQRFKRLRFGYTVILKTFLFAAAFIAAVVFFIQIKNYLLAPSGLYERPVHNELGEFFGSPVFFKHGLYAVLFSFGINFFLQIDNKMGKNVLFNLFFGRFHKPRKLVKIIMFLDLTSSTSIAEKIGDHKYSALLRDFFFDIDEIISETKGAVYQYIGDEVVILWDVKEGIDNSNCIRCYYESKKSIYNKMDKYKELYNAFPQFKAGIHLGEVIVTEVGGLKSEIAYHGDTVNTASRLCAEARNYESGLLISAELLSLLKCIDESYRIESVGLIKFKGKKHDIAAFSVFEK
ncbi:MAG: adenylate/guanylate cyclase domain-containing protein [Ignavibacteria bacterium]